MVIAAVYFPEVSVFDECSKTGASALRCSRCLTRYTPDAAAPQQVSVDFGLHQPQEQRWRRMQLSDYIGQLPQMLAEAEQQGVQPPYLRTWNFYEDIPGLMDDWADPPHFADSFKKLQPEQQPPFTWMFIGPKGCQTKLHVDIWYVP